MANDIIGQNPTLSPDSVPEGFSPAQTIAMGALLAGKPKSTAARLAGVSRSTVHKWLADDPRFSAFYASARREMADSVEQSIRLLSGTAVKTLRRLLTKRSVADETKLRASLALLAMASKPVEGPEDVEDAINKILQRRGVRESESMRARIGYRNKEVLKDLERQLEKVEVDDD